MNKQKLLQNLKKFGNLPVRKSKTSKSQIHIMTQPATFLLKSALCILAIATTATAAERFFTPPDAPFIIGAKDKVERITLTNSGGKPVSFLDRLRGVVEKNSVSMESAQALIDEARAKNPNALLVIEASAHLEIGASPLRLSGRMWLKLSPDAGVIAASDCTATSLIEIKDAEFVSVTSTGTGLALIDGGGKQVTGITVIGGSKVNFDELAIQDCAVTAIDYKGRDAAVLNQGASATRCRFLNNKNGLVVDGTGGFQCLDNIFKSNTGTALTINSVNAVVAGNEFSDNKAAIRSGSDRAAIARNRISDTGALELTATSSGHLITENICTAPNAQILLAGSGQQVFRNDIRGVATLAPESKEMFLVSNVGLEVNPNAAGLRLFNPPTFGNPHKQTTIVAGMGRFDLPTITGGKMARDKAKDPGIPAVDLAVVQEALLAARTEHPNDVLVLKLEGEFVSRNPAGLALPPNTCLILEGRILAELGTPLEPAWEREAEHSQLILLPKTGYVSVSGGRLDAARQAFFPINAKTGSVAVIDSVSMASGARDGINTKTRSKDPLFIYGCNVYANGGRGIWAHVCTRVHSIANVCNGNNMDGIDLDAGCIDGTALFNTCSANRRHGIFMEEGIQNNVAFGNSLNGNIQAGIHVWNEEVKKNTGPNVISANECNGNRRGTSVGGRAADKTAHGNFFFNNICRKNRLDGILAGNSSGNDNYFSQIVIGQNYEKDISTTDGAAATFFSTVSPTTP